MKKWRVSNLSDHLQLKIPKISLPKQPKYQERGLDKTYKSASIDLSETLNSYRLAG